jgi:hypothetical protein
MQVDAPGDYTLMVRGSKFWQTPYYAGFPDTSSGPSSITVSCGNSVTANFHVEQTIFTVKGRVTRQSDGAGILGMRVKFMSVQSTSVVESDTNGYYSIDLLKGYTYTVMAEPRVGDGYVAQYYDHAADEASATTILLYSDKTNINFSLAARPNYDNSISGSLRDSLGNALAGSVILYQVSSVNNEYESPRTIMTDSSNGSFSFANIAPGSYVLQGAPVYWDSMMFAAGYYKQGAMSVVSWQDATQIRVGGTDNISNAVIRLRRIDGLTGSAILSGTITTDKGRSLKGGGHSIQSATPVAGVLVTAVDENNRISGYTYTDASGNFQLSAFAKGTYTVIADKVGFDAIRSVETFTEDGVTRKSDLTLKVEGTSSVPVVAGPVTGGTISVWPNPATSHVTLRFAATQGTARISIVDALGEQVASTAVTTEQGENEYALAIDGLSTGVYMVQVESGSLRTVAPIHIVR